MVPHSFIHSFHKYVLNTSHNFHLQLSAEDIVNKQKEASFFIHGDYVVLGYPQCVASLTPVLRGNSQSLSPVAYELVREVSHLL